MAAPKAFKLFSGRISLLCGEKKRPNQFLRQKKLPAHEQSFDIKHN